MSTSRTNEIPEGRRLTPTRSLPRRPWVACNQYGMHFITSQDNEIIIRADHIPFGMLGAMAQAANTWEENAEVSQMHKTSDVKHP